MKTFLLFQLILMLLLAGQNGTAPNDDSLVEVRAIKCSKSRLTIVNPDNTRVTPAPAMIPANKNFERTRRVNDQAGAIDPNTETLDGRSAALEKIMQESRSPKNTPVDGFAYQIKLRNANKKAIEVMFWEYQFKELSNPENVVRRQFLCGVNIKPGKEQEVRAFSVLGPGDMISVDSLSNKSGKLFDEKVVINRVEYADGSIWQRKDWNYSEVGAAIKRALATPWGAEMCRSL